MFRADGSNWLVGCVLLHIKLVGYLMQMEVPVVQWLSSQDMDTATRVQILEETDCISHSTNTRGRGKNPNILPPAIGK